MEIVTSGERKGVEKGRLEELAEARMEGALDALHTVLIDLVSARFGVSPDSVASRIRQINSIGKLRSLSTRTIAAKSLTELGL